MARNSAAKEKHEDSSVQGLLNLGRGGRDELTGCRLMPRGCLAVAGPGTLTEVVPRWYHRQEDNL